MVVTVHRSRSYKFSKYRKSYSTSAEQVTVSDSHELSEKPEPDARNEQVTVSDSHELSEKPEPDARNAEVVDPKL